MTTETARLVPQQHAPRHPLKFRSPDIAPPAPVVIPQPVSVERRRSHGLLKSVLVLGLAAAAVRTGVHWDTEHAPSQTAAAMPNSANSFVFHTVKTATYLDISRLVFHRSAAPTLEEHYSSYPKATTITLGYGSHTKSFNYDTTPEDAATSIADLSSPLRLSNLSCHGGHLTVQAAFGSPQYGPQHTTLPLTDTCKPGEDLSSRSSVIIAGQQYLVSP